MEQLGLYPGPRIGWINTILSIQKVIRAKCFVSLLRTDKLYKSIILDQQKDFVKELTALFLNADKDHTAQIKYISIIQQNQNEFDVLISCKALCNFALEFERLLIKDEKLIRKLVELTYSTNLELKEVCCYTLKNIVFNSNRDAREAVLRELTSARLLELLDEEDDSGYSLSIQEQVLIMYRNLLTVRISLPFNDAAKQDACMGDQLICEDLFHKLQHKLDSPHDSLVVNALYVLSSIASYSPTHKLRVCQYLTQIVYLLTHNQKSDIKVGCLHLVLSLVMKEMGSGQQSGQGEKARAIITEMRLREGVLKDMGVREKDGEVRRKLATLMKELV